MVKVNDSNPEMVETAGQCVVGEWLDRQTDKVRANVDRAAEYQTRVGLHAMVEELNGGVRPFGLTALKMHYLGSCVCGKAIVTPMRPEVQNRVLILDVERLPGITKQFWWDRGDLKNRYIGYESVERLPRTTLVCAKWYDSPDVIALAEWDKGGRKQFLANVHALISEADIVVGHWITGADIPWLKGDMHIEAGLPPLPPFKTVDTLTVLRKEFKSGAPFKGLDAFCQIAGIPGKTDKYDRDAMERAVNGSVEDRERLTAYCSGDVIATQGLLDYLRPHIKNHPALMVDGSTDHCNRCGSETTAVEKRFVANLLSYSMVKCVSCGAYSRLSIEPERVTTLRGV